MGNGLSFSELKEFLEQKYVKYNALGFIDSDPIQVPHMFNKKEDIEICSFLTSTPFDFIMNSSEKEINNLSIKHRTFNEIDFRYFIKRLNYIYSEHGSIENIFKKFLLDNRMHNSIHNFKRIFFEDIHPKRTTKHVSDPYKGSACKRLNMFLRWMVRKDNNGVDFGIWKKISSSDLSCPLDVHSGRVARKLGLLKRSQNDHKAVIELDNSLRKLDKTDPVKYDFSLFGLGVFEGF